MKKEFFYLFSFVFFAGILACSTQQKDQEIKVDETTELTEAIIDEAAIDSIEVVVDDLEKEIDDFLESLD